jgi:hypothetical protein
MMIRRSVFSIILLVSSLQVFGWGATGHRVTGYIAQKHLNKKAKAAIQKLLGQQTLDMASTWMDEIKSDKAYDHTHDWHWVTIDEGKTYEQMDRNKNGDLLVTIERLVAELKSKKYTGNEEVERLKMLIHLIGDIHQPLHVGFGDDNGGNSVRLTWFGENSNLHKVWDSKMIEFTELSYTELAESLPKPDAVQIKNWQSAGVRDWVAESISYRKQVYDIGDGKLYYPYPYKNLPIVRERLLQAGVRMAGVLNEIYGK